MMACTSPFGTLRLRPRMISWSAIPACKSRISNRFILRASNLARNARFATGDSGFERREVRLNRDRAADSEDLNGIRETREAEGAELLEFEMLDDQRRDALAHDDLGVDLLGEFLQPPAHVYCIADDGKFHPAR